MKRTRTLLVSALASAALLGAGASAANAQVWPGWGMPYPESNGAGAGPVRSGECGSSSGPENQGGTAGTTTYLCLGTGLQYVGPQIGQVASVVGPTIIGPGFVSNVNVTAGNAAIGVGP